MHPDEQEHPDKIRVFPIGDPNDWVKNQDFIKKVILKATDPALPGYLKIQHHFSIDPISGWIRYNLENDLWSSKPKRSLPKDRTEATGMAQKFLSDLQQAVSSQEYAESGIPPVVPAGKLARIKHIETCPVAHNQQPWVDHWLCRFEVYIQPYENSEIPVYGSSIEIRIGQRGKVVGFVSQWRPVWLNKELLVDFIPYDQDNQDSNHSHEEDEEAGASDPILIYELDGENCIQNYLTPYHLLLEGHHGGKYPASSYSIEPEIFFSRENLTTRALAAVKGGSGSYSVSWACWSPDDPFDTGIISLGQEASIELPPGIYNLMLHLEDEQTGVRKLFEKMAFVKGETTQTEV